jgi:hypothetical protein
MNPTTMNERKNFIRLEDSFSRPENQKHFPEDPYVEEEEKRVMEQIHEQNLRRKQYEYLTQF